MEKKNIDYIKGDRDYRVVEKKYFIFNDHERILF